MGKRRRRGMWGACHTTCLSGAPPPACLWQLLLFLPWSLGYPLSFESGTSLGVNHPVISGFFFLFLFFSWLDLNNHLVLLCSGKIPHSLVFIWSFPVSPGLTVGFLVALRLFLLLLDVRNNSKCCQFSTFQINLVRKSHILISWRWKKKPSPVWCTQLRILYLLSPNVAYYKL